MTVVTERFAGFRPAAFAFFSELKSNNDPVWFKPRKALYEAEVLAPFRELIAAVSDALGQAGLPLVGDPRRGIFRIYRDVRFSPDKRLYKTHAGAVLTRSGGRRETLVTAPLPAAWSARSRARDPRTPCLRCRGCATRG